MRVLEETKEVKKERLKDSSLTQKFQDSDVLRKTEVVILKQLVG
jgi:hypothetical protein